MTPKSSRPRWPVWLLAALPLLFLALPVATGRAGAASTTSTSSVLPTTTTSTTVPGGAPPPINSPGYWMAASDGGVYQFGTTNFGGMRGTHLDRPVVGGAATPDGLGYWMVASDGGIFSFGDAGFHGSAGGVPLVKPVVGMAADPATGGYWLVASDGGIFSYGAPFFGSTGNIALNKPIVGMASTPDGRGYWLVASDGGVFTFGDARFYGSTGNIALWQPVVGMAPTPDGHGYWLVASDGGIFSFGDARFHGSTGGVHLAKPVEGMSATADGAGYWLFASDGGVFTFGDAPFLGSAAADNSPAPIVTMMATATGFPFPPGGTGYDISQYQCPSNGGTIPSQHQAVGVVQVSGGAINRGPNPCYYSEALWAGANMSAYIFMNPLPSPPPVESLNGPAGQCAPTDTNCLSYNFGYYWAQHWVSYSRSQHIYPTLWWLDVEFDGGWGTSSSNWPANSAVIDGAVAGLRASSVLPGIYATAYQWGQITGNQPNFPGIALWVPGAGNVSSGAHSATSFCTNPSSTYAPFAGGSVVLVQYGYAGNGYTGPSVPYDQDYACK